MEVHREFSLLSDAAIASRSEVGASSEGSYSGENMTLPGVVLAALDLNSKVRDVYR